MKLVTRYLLLITFCLFIVTVCFAETKKAEKVTFNFVDVDLSTVTKFISEITKKNFIFDERVKGKITIIAPSKLSVEDAYSLFTSVLELKGFTVVPSGIDAYKIIPAIEAKQRGIQITTEKLPVNESYIARLVSLNSISSDDALKFLQPVVSKDGHISTFGPGNLLLVIDSGLNIEKILSIIEIIDQPSVREEPEIVLLKYSSADVIAKILNEGLGRGKIRAVPGQQIQTEEARAVADQRLNAVVLFGDKGIRESMKGLIALLDIPSPEAQGRINVYFLENADATELSKVLEGILKSTQATRQPTTGVPGAPIVTPFEAAGVITVTPDKATNALVIVASPADYQNLIQVIKQLDKRRKQVFVEAMIVEASMDKLRELGTNWRAIGRSEGEPVIIGGVGAINSTAIQSIISGLSGLTIGGMGNYLSIPVTASDGTSTNITVPGFAALFSISEFQGVVNVLSTPQILTSDNKEAEIVVGENVPMVSKRESDPTRTLSLFTTIERKDVGITLRLTPQITEGDYVKLDIYQEISSVKQESENILISVGPTTTKRSTKTSVVVKDTQTVVIGGLMQEKDEETISKVPILGDIPLLGWLFKYKNAAKTKTNLLVFLTPHIVKEAEDLVSITKDKKMEFAKSERQYLEGELLIKFKEGVTGEKALAIITGKGASVIKFIENIGVYHIKLKKGQDVEDAIKEFTDLPEVEYAEPNYRIKIK
ncbi:MAG: type II secretion system protein GspD [Nitrospira sp.]|nr:type II secretion system protein GspD [Nitrospira sp.]